MYEREPIQCKIIILFDATIGYDSSRKAAIHCIENQHHVAADYKKNFGTSHYFQFISSGV